MRERLHVRRFGGMTAVFLGLAGVFSALTLSGLGSHGWASVAVIGGVLVTSVGLSSLPRPGCG